MPVWGVWTPQGERWYMSCVDSAHKVRNIRDKYHDGTWSKVQMVSAVRGNASFEVISRRAVGMIKTPELFSSAATRWAWPAA